MGRSPAKKTSLTYGNFVSASSEPEVQIISNPKKQEKSRNDYLSSDYMKNTLGYEKEEEDIEPVDTSAICQYKIKCWCPKTDCKFTHLTLQSSEGKAVFDGWKEKPRDFSRTTRKNTE